MTSNQTIDGVSRRMLTALLCQVSEFHNRALVDELRALLEAPATEVRDKCGVQMVDCPECSHQWDHYFECGNMPATQPLGEPVTIEAVAVTRDNGDGSLRLEWLLEGGIAQMEFAGMVLFAIPEANELCDEDGSAEVYLSPQPAEQPAPIAVVPEGYCVMPSQLTAENGAKALLLAEDDSVADQAIPFAFVLPERKGPHQYRDANYTQSCMADEWNNCLVAVALSLGLKS